MSKHTPGPWQVYRRSIVTASDKSIVAEIVVNGDQSETKSNAYLIAAAPNMLEALKQAKTAMLKTGPRPNTDDEIMHLLDAAIAKAEGK
jgi:hypothetical protein